MLNTLLLVIALQAGDWQCSQEDALWECSPSVQATPKVQRSAAPSGDTTAPQPLTRVGAAAADAAGGGPLAGNPAAADAAAGDPAGGGPLAGNPAAADAAAGDPAGGGPLAGNPAAADAAGGGPLAGDPAAADALASPTPPVQQESSEPSTAAPATGAAAGTGLITSRPPSTSAGGSGASSAYVVQIGAYSQKSTAQAAADELDYAGLVIMPTRRDGKDWFVLLLGAFPTLAEARAAGDAFTRVYPDGSFWVRSVEDLRGVLSQ